MLQSPDFNQINTAEGPVGVFNYPHGPSVSDSSLLIKRLQLFVSTNTYWNYSLALVCFSTFVQCFLLLTDILHMLIKDAPLFHSIHRTAPCPSFPLVTWLHLLFFVYTTFLLFFLLLNLHFSNPLKCILYMHYGSHNLVPQKHSCFRVLMKYNCKKNIELLINFENRWCFARIRWLICFI